MFGFKIISNKEYKELTKEKFNSDVAEMLNYAVKNGFKAFDYYYRAYESGSSYSSISCSYKDVRTDVKTLEQLERLKEVVDKLDVENMKISK